jgi:energy-coupling factor transporter ATP-binding protein EcfA2
MASIADLLSAARRRSFVGREQEIELFRQFLQPGQQACILLYIYGPGGQGKTTLTKHLTDLCAERQIAHVLVDARETEPHPTAFLEAVRSAIDQTSTPAHPDPNSLFDLLADRPGRVVLFIDTFEKITPIEDWIRLEFLPRLPSNVLTVMAGRNAPSLNWMTDAGWKSLMKTIQLRNFTSAESEEYLRLRNIPEDKVRQIIQFTHGHPLALSVVADIYEQYPDKNFSPDESPDVVRTLLQLFVRQVPSPMHRAALEVCALVNLLTESLLAEVMDVSDVSELFNWMCGLSFISIGKGGIYPHDIAREALIADLRWRHPDWNAELHKRARTYYHKKLKETAGEAQRKVLFDLLYLHRLNPVVKPFFEWQEAGSFWLDSFEPQDIPLLRAMVERQEGAESLAVFNFWCQHPAAQIWVWRDGTRAPNAFVLKINGHEVGASQEVSDPVMQEAIRYQRENMQLRPGEQVAMFRMWMAKDTHQGVSPLQSSMFLTIVQYYFTPGLAVSLLAVVHPEFWKPAFQYADLTHVPSLDFSSGGTPFGWYQHDWRVRPPFAWLDLLGKRETGGPQNAESETPSVQVLVLNEETFLESAAEALRQFHNNNLLVQNSLLRCKLVVQESGDTAPESTRIAVLKEKISACLKEIEESPVDGKYFRVLYRTYINPVGSQEKAADFLNMSFSTYRRYLQAGTQRIGEMLWAKELG